jgi:hypothetical protein
MNEIDNDSKSSISKIAEVIRSLREIIGRHEKAMIQQVLMAEKNQRRQFEDYKTVLTCELQCLNTQKATLEVLLSSKNQTKLLQSSKRFVEYVEKTKGTLKSLSMPTRTHYYLHGLDQLQILGEKIPQCGKYIEVPPYRNPQLEKIIDDKRTKQELNFSHKNLIDSDMMIVANLLRNSTVGIEYSSRLAFLAGAGGIYV